MDALKLMIKLLNHILQFFFLNDFIFWMEGSLNPNSMTQNFELAVVHTG